MPAANPFAIDGPPPEPDDAGFVEFAISYGAASLWDVMAELPRSPEVTLAQRRLEEAVFWAKRAAETAT